MNKILFIISRSIHLSTNIFLKRGTKPDHTRCREGFVPNFENILKACNGYTHEPLEFRKLGGRDKESGQRICRRGGGGKRHFVLVDRYRILFNQSPMFEKVIQIINNYPLHSSNLALLAGGTKKRWIICTENMKVGDVLKSSGIIPRMPVRAIEGEAHPLGALPVGTLVNSVEMRPGWGSNWAMAAGTACQIIRQASVQDSVNDHVILRLPSKQEVNLSRECIATVGRCSNPEHKHMVIGGPLQKRYLGYRPRSGLWHRKDGTCGRKIRPLPPIRIYDKLTSDSGSSGGLVNELKPSYHATNKFADMDKKDKRYKNYMALQKRMQYKRKNLLIAYYNNLNSRPYISPAEKCRLISLTPRFINLDR